VKRYSRFAIGIRSHYIDQSYTRHRVFEIVREISTIARGLPFYITPCRDPPKQLERNITSARGAFDVRLELTRRVLLRNARDILSEDDVEAPRMGGNRDRFRRQSLKQAKKQYSPFKMPVDVAKFAGDHKNPADFVVKENSKHEPVEKPRSSVVRFEPDGDIITGISYAHNVSANRVVVVVCIVSCTSYDGERVLAVHQYVETLLLQY
jgi:hypothetical protein